jgi:cytochrome d ubiquinol oxidase subunit II
MSCSFRVSSLRQPPCFTSCLFPSVLNPAWSLTARNASSSPLNLKIILVVVILVVPVVLIYQIWVYHLFKGKVTEEKLAYDEAY